MMNDMPAVQVQIYAFGENATGNQYLRKKWRVERKEQRATSVIANLSVRETYVRKEDRALVRGIAFGRVKGGANVLPEMRPGLNLVQSIQVLATFVLSTPLNQKPTETLDAIAQRLAILLRLESLRHTGGKVGTFQWEVAHKK